jgi:hypothetical protein
MCGLLGKVAREIDNLNGLERTLLDANTTTDAQHLRNLGDLNAACDCRWYHDGRFA